MKKYKFYERFKDADETIQQLVWGVLTSYKTKYFNVWMSKYKWAGLDEDNKEQQENYIMKKLWKDGKVAIRNISNTDLIAICPFSESDYNIYDYPDTVSLTNERGVAESIIPKTLQIVNKDVALVYCTPGKNSIESIVNYFVDRIIQVELLINNNLKLQNMPFVIGVDETDKKQFEDIVTRILNNELVVYTSVGDLNKLQTLATNAPYLVDKLKQYEVSIENELLTVLGINNTGTQAKKAQMLVDEVNANNDVINDYGMAITDEIKKWLARANKVLGRNISIEVKSVAEDQESDYEDASIKESKKDEKMV